MTGNSSEDYRPETTARVVATCLSLAQILGEDLVRHTTIVGGLVPSLLYARARIVSEIFPHVGTRDLDLALDVAVLEERVYENIASRLIRAGFRPDRNATGRPTRQRWRADDVPGSTS